MKTKDLMADIVISGGGPAGLTLAALLGQVGLKVVLIDTENPLRKQPERPSGRTAALLNNSINVLKAASVWQNVENSVTPLRTMRIVDDSIKGRATVNTEFHADTIGQEQFGFNIPNLLLKTQLQKTVAIISEVRILAPTRLQNFTVTHLGVLVETEDGQSITANLVIGMDGRTSAVRRIVGIEAATHDYGQTAMTCLLSHSKPHDFTSTEFHRSGGPFTFVPMNGNLSSLVWVEKTDDAKKFLSMKKNEFQQAIQDRSLGLLGTIKMESEPESWPLMLLSAERLTSERCAIAAEAAHVLSPIAAQGLNLSLRDVAALAETLIDAMRMGEDIGSLSVLGRYERRRKADIAMRVRGVDRLNRSVASEFLPLKDLRRAGLQGLNTIPLLKNFVARQGLDPAMDQGRLLQGKAL